MKFAPVMQYLSPPTGVPQNLDFEEVPASAVDPAAKMHPGTGAFNLMATPRARSEGFGIGVIWMRVEMQEMRDGAGELGRIFWKVYESCVILLSALLRIPGWSTWFLPSRFDQKFRPMFRKIEQWTTKFQNLDKGRPPLRSGHRSASFKFPWVRDLSSDVTSFARWLPTRIQNLIASKRTVQFRFFLLHSDHIQFNAFIVRSRKPPPSPHVNSVVEWNALPPLHRPPAGNQKGD